MKKKKKPETSKTVQSLQNITFSIIDPMHDKTNKLTCAPSEDSDEPGHPPSLIRVFAVCMKKRWVLFIRFTASAFRKLPSIYVFSYFPFGLRAGCGI